MRKFFLLLFYIVPSLLFSQSESSEPAETMATELEPRTFEMTIAESEAEFEFYQGVNLFHSGNIPLALLAFQKAISFSHDSEKNPDEAFQVLNPLIYKFWFA